MYGNKPIKDFNPKPNKSRVSVIYNFNNTYGSFSKSFISSSDNKVLRADVRRISASAEINFTLFKCVFITIGTK